MARHRRGRVGWVVGRRRYMELLRAYESLMSDYAAQGADLQRVLEDREAILYGRETGEYELPDPEPQPEPERRQRVPSWAETTPLPAVADPMPPPVAAELVAKAGLLDDPGGETSRKNG